ncbi:MAG: cupin domain-containing protein [Balneolales bacterium]|nr:cupin domain-containing protein [Balneolales bacterium]
MAEKPTPEERDYILNLVKPHLDLQVTSFGQPVRSVVRIDKRPAMYGGNGTVYLLQMFDRGELVNNRIGCYMVLPGKGDESGFHEHGRRKEEELYVVMSGKGLYLDRDGEIGTVREQIITRGQITAVKGDGFHSVINTEEEPLILFVITTNEPK